MSQSNTCTHRIKYIKHDWKTVTILYLFWPVCINVFPNGVRPNAGHNSLERHGNPFIQMVMKCVRRQVDKLIEKENSKKNGSQIKKKFPRKPVGINNNNLNSCQSCQKKVDIYILYIYYIYIMYNYII